MKIFGRNVSRTCLSMLMIIVCLGTSLLFLGINADAKTIKMGTVTASSLHLRADAGKDYAHITYLYKGDKGIIVGEKKASSGTIWYKMEIKNYVGWASSAYIDVSETIVEDEDHFDADFDAYLSAKGFPDSYKSKLQTLHAKYPNWKFEAQITNLKWADVIAAESEVGVNTVENSRPTSWKSTATGAYNWSTGKWTEIDSGGWVAASSEIIQYYMDPRNFLDETYVFQFLVQSYDAKSENLTSIRNNLKKMCEGSFLADGYGGNKEAYYDDIMNAGATYKVSPYVLAAMIMQEQGRNGSGSSISGNEPGYKGYYNFLNVGAYAKNGMTAVQRGLWYASGSGKGETTYHRPWNNRKDSIMGGAQHYGEGFVSVGQDTMYLKKFDLIGSLYTHQYMTNIAGGCSEGKILARAYDETARQSATMVFKIPVFKDMPKEPCKQPTGDGNPNYMLTSLAVNGYNLTPSFSMYEQEYSLIVPYNVTSITISATAASSTAKVTGTGAVQLEVGSKKINVEVSAQNGSKRIYTITIVRSGNDSSPQPVPAPTLTSSKYKVVNSQITGIEPGVSVSAFKQNVSSSGATITVYDANGKVNNGTVGTGNVVKVVNSAGSKNYTVIIYGDTNGDGKIGSLDLLQVKRHIVKASTLNGVYSLAADTSKDGKIGSLDLLQVKRHIVKATNIQQ